jgi:hypothetical protein
MSTQVRSKTLVIPIDTRKNEKKGKIQRYCKFLLALTVWAWTTAVLCSILFLYGVRNQLDGMEWLGGLLLGLVGLGWVATLQYIKVANQPKQNVRQGDEDE